MTIAITGVGAVSALGGTAAETWTRIVRGERAFAPLTLFDTTGYRANLVGEVKDIPATGRADQPDFSRTSELAIRAAREALAQAELPPGRSLRIGLVLGGTTAGMLETESLLAVLLSPEGHVDPEARKTALSQMLTHPLSAPTDRMVRELGPFHRVRSLSSACSGGANAIMTGALWIELGLCDVVLAGAADAICRVTMSGFNALGAMDPNGARPFDVKRRGLTLGEGAGFVVLEKIGRKRAICTLLGWAARSEASHITNPEPTGEAPFQAMTAALSRAGLGAADVDWVNAHGTGTPLNDPMETNAIRRALGREADRVPVSSQKGQIGHTLAACGAIEAALSAMAIDRSVIPPTGGLEDPDPACQLVHVREAIETKVDIAISSSFGFGGMDTVLVLGGPERRAPERAPARRVYVTGVATLTPQGLRVGSDVLGPTMTRTNTDVDPVRGRRLDRASRLGAVTVEAAFGGAPPPHAGVVLGSAFGAVDATSAFMRRLNEKGPRLVSPADFPSLVPSSPAGHISIYLGLRGPTMVVADLATSGEAAVTTAYELIASGEADRITAVAVEERSTIVEEVLSVLFHTNGAERGEGASAIALASDPDHALAQIDRLMVWRDHAPALPSPPPGAVVVSREPFVWGDAEQVLCNEAKHEAAGAMAIAMAAARIAAGASAALAIGAARGSGYALFLSPCAASS